jgi:hypothetical protein
MIALFYTLKFVLKMAASKYHNINTTINMKIPLPVKKVSDRTDAGMIGIIINIITANILSVLIF